MAQLNLERRISGKAFLGHHVLAIVLGIVLAAILFATGLGMFAPVGILPIIGTFAYAHFHRISTCYRLEGDRIEIESGLLSRKIENVELFRIRDVGLRQGLFGKMADFGDVYIHSTDSSTPDLHVRGIDHPRDFYQQLRAGVSESRAAHRTMIIEEGNALPEP